MEIEETNNTLNEIQVKYDRKFRGPQLKSPGLIADYIRTFFPEDQIDYRELGYVILIDFGLQVIGHFQISAGALAQTHFDFRHMFSTAIKCNAAGLIMVHNHPTGRISPSPTDITLTKKAIKAGELLGIEVLDHIIITKISYSSIMEYLKGDI